MRTFSSRLLSLFIVAMLFVTAAIAEAPTAVTLPTQEEALKTLGLEKVPESVTCSSVSSTRLAVALGLPIIAVPETQSTLPDAVKDLPRIGGGMNPDVETIKAAGADLVLCEILFREKLEPMMKEHNIPHYFVNCNMFDNVLSEVALLGTAFGKTAEAQAILDDYQTRTAETLAKVEGKPSPNVMILFGSPQNYMIGGSNTFVGDLCKKLGATNITVAMGLEESAENGGFQPLSEESAAFANPDIILCLGHGTAEMQKAFEDSFVNNPAWSAVNAIKNKRIVFLESTLFGTNGGVHAIDSLVKLADYLYE